MAAKDIRHILSGLLTASMLLMFCNMIKKDHIDPLLADVIVQPTTANEKNETSLKYKRGLIENCDPWGVNNTKEVFNPCWRKSTHPKPQESRGFIFVTLAYGPEYHLLQIANAVVVAKYLGATLVLPDLRLSEPRRKGKFGEIYDLNHFTASLDGKVPLLSMESQSADLPNEKVITVRVPNMVSIEFIKSNLEPIFKITKSLRLSTYFSSSNMKHRKMDPYACLGMYDTLMLRPELQESLGAMIGTLRSFGSGSEKRFVAVDYRVPGSSSKCLHSPTGTKPCFDATEMAEFLEKVGFENDTTIYLTLNGWHASVEHLRNVFPNTFTKDVIFPAEEKSKFQDNPELKKILDFYISSTADVFVPTTSNLFSDHVIARRIFTGKTHVLVSNISSSSHVAKDYIPPNVAHKKHRAYSCFC